MAEDTSPVEVPSTPVLVGSPIWSLNPELLLRYVWSMASLPQDLTDVQWALLDPLIPEPERR